MLSGLYRGCQLFFGGFSQSCIRPPSCEEIVSRTLLAIKDKLALLEHDALEAKFQAFPEMTIYEGDDISLSPPSSTTRPTLPSNSSNDEL